MENPVITYAINMHHDNPEVSLGFVRGCGLIDEVNPLESIAWKNLLKILTHYHFKYILLSKIFLNGHPKENTAS